MLNVVHTSVLARGGVPSENDKRLWSAEIKPPSPCVSLWFLYWCKTWYLRTFYSRYRCHRSASGWCHLQAHVLHYSYHHAFRPMFCITVVIIMLSGPCFALQLSSSCFQRYSKAEMDRVSIAFILGYHGAEMKFHQQIPQLLPWSEREECCAFVPTYEQALKRTVCITLTQPPLVQYHDLWRMHFQLRVETKLESTYSVPRVVSLSETKIAYSTKLVLMNHLKTKRRLLYLNTQSYRAVNTFHLGYKNPSVYAVSGTSRCSQINTKHIKTVWEGSTVEC